MNSKIKSDWRFYVLNTLKYLFILCKSNIYILEFLHILVKMYYFNSLLLPTKMYIKYKIFKQLFFYKCSNGNEMAHTCWECFDRENISRLISSWWTDKKLSSLREEKISILPMRRRFRQLSPKAAPAMVVELYPRCFPTINSGWLAQTMSFLVKHSSAMEWEETTRTRRVTTLREKIEAPSRALEREKFTVKRQL